MLIFGLDCTIRRHVLKKIAQIVDFVVEGQEGAVRVAQRKDLGEFLADCTV